MYNLNKNFGFVQIPLLIIFVIAVVTIGGAGYLGVRQYQSHQAQNNSQQIISETNKAASTTELLDVDKLKQEIEELKKQQSSFQSQTQSPAPKQEVVNPAPNKRVVLSNADIIRKVKPATVFIETTRGAGSGMIIDANGYILTNAHVVWDVSAAEIKLSDGRSLSAEVIGRDEIVDLAILKIVGSGFSKVSFGNSDNVIQGEDVFTLGYPFGLEGDVSFKEGTISRRISSDDTTYLETSAEIHPGNSGGPLVNKYGEVVGINTASYGQTIEGVIIGETIKLAIPINVAKDFIPRLKDGREIVIDHTQYVSEPSVPSQSQILEDQANQALLESLYSQDNDKAWERFYSFNDAWRENPARNCRNEATYSYEIAKLVMGALQDNLMKKYGKSLNWLNAIEFTFKSWCLDRGY